MALVSSLFTAISGLRNHQTLLDVISNNVANVNTVGFKAGRVQFRDLLSQTIQSANGTDSANNRGGTNPIQFGSGVSVAAIDTLQRQGTLQATGNATDMAITGDGFFLTKSGTQTQYTRAGSFRFDTSGNLVDPSGGNIQGWTASVPATDRLGEPTLDTSNPTRIGNIKIMAGQTLSAHETRNLTLVGNLDAGANAANLVNSLGQPGTTQLTGQDQFGNPLNMVVGQDKIQMPVYDSLGNVHNLTMTLTNLSGTPVPSDDLGAGPPPPFGAESGVPFVNVYDNNTWAWTVDTDPADTTVHLALDNSTFIDPTDSTNTIRASSSGIIHFTTTGAVDYVVYQDRNAEHFGTDANTGLPNDPNSPPGWTGEADTDTFNHSVIGFEGATVAAPSVAPFVNFQNFALTKLPIVLVYQQVPAPSAGPLPTSTTAGTRVQSTFAGPPVTVGNGVNQAGNDAIREDWYVQTMNIDWGTVSTITGANFGPINDVGDNRNGLDFLENPAAVISSNNTIRDGLTQDAVGTVDNNGVYKPVVGNAHMVDQDGYAEGTLNSISVSGNGAIVGTFSNGKSVSLAQVAIASFQNPAGLAKVGDTHFVETANSGNAIIGTALSGGRGAVVGGVVEQSNVDLSEELTNMIVAQRGFEANARLISTSDKILDTLVNLGR